MLRAGQFEAQALGLLGEEAMGNLDQDAGAVARLGVGAHGTAVLEVLEDGQAVGHHAVAFGVGDIGDEADAAGIVLVARIIETMRVGKSFWPVLDGHGQLLVFFLSPFYPQLARH